MKSWKYLLMTTMVGSALALGACGTDSTEEAETDTESASSASKDSQEEAVLEGKVSGDGSSTVAPILEAVVEEYSTEQSKVQVTVGVSGTGGGFEKFIAGDTDFSNASRPIKEEEKQKLDEAGVDFTEFQIAYDGLSLVVNKDNDWVDSLTIEELKKMWIEDGTEKKWSDINPEWPDEKIVFYSPGTDSGTYDYFDEVVLDEADLVKSAQLSEDDNVLVQGVQGDKNAIAFFGYAYYLANQDTLKVVKVEGIEPTNETIESGEYSPLSRPLFVYAKNSAIKENPAFYDFMKYTIEKAGEMAEAVGYVSLPEEEYEKGLADLEALK
ncbi:PstS family phosphate ABC transporter substrate-binding protein [Psychrobacillus sp. AK 1817]|uniref:Phosphate-binding protein n=1 Tax=Psychrobacillus faecigallinarum TaxID=2762235 RepID=A0ABR8R7T4_9BACI|nr:MULTISPECIES: PstS family phosphate ABC transporter substrate-binding protein [Psychrobacillus]MBD7943871.1 PstS family phosphate ABC transporter substrate-binding protein [Psychrobacillus faecigallinarum]QEY19379.1 PstS family phosphate ABC transporter substrate-binding protein [Psychrobacillus sp. AK 1817]